MRDEFIFKIKALSIEEGFVLIREEGHPLGPLRLIEAVIHATQMARHLRARIEIFDSSGDLVETIGLNSPGIVHDYLVSLAA